MKVKVETIYKDEILDLGEVSNSSYDFETDLIEYNENGDIIVENKGVVITIFPIEMFKFIKITPIEVTMKVTLIDREIEKLIAEMEEDEE